MMVAIQKATRTFIAPRHRYSKTCHAIVAVSPHTGTVHTRDETRLIGKLTRSDASTSEITPAIVRKDSRDAIRYYAEEPLSNFALLYNS